MAQQVCVKGVWCVQGCLCMEVGSRVAGSEVGSCGMGRGSELGLGWCLCLEPVGVLLLLEGW